MKRQLKSSLPKGIDKRVALNYQFWNIKPRLLPSLVKGFWRFKNILPKLVSISFFITLFLGLYPNVNLPHHLSNYPVLAAEQKLEVIAAFLPEPATLPHPGYLSSSFSRWHPGIDIATGLGMPIRPINSGVVEDIIYSFWGYGNHVIISHPQGFKSLYAHMGRVYVKKGQSVNQASTLGEVGMTGRTSGPHTHLEITKDGQYIDPQTILPKVSEYPTYANQSIKPPSGGENKKLRSVLKPDFN